MIESFHRQHEEEIEESLEDTTRYSRRIFGLISRTAAFIGIALAGCISPGSPILNDGGDGDGDISYPICPDDEIILSHDVSTDDCFSVGCFDEVVQQITAEQITAQIRAEIAAGHNIVTIHRNESAVVVGGSDIIEAPSVSRCAIVAVFAYDKDGQIVRGLAHIDSGSVDVDVRLFELIARMRNQGNVVGRIYIYVFSGQRERNGQGNLNLNYMQEALRFRYLEGLCAIGFRDDLIPEEDHRMNVYSIFDPVGKRPYIFYSTDSPK